MGRTSLALTTITSARSCSIRHSTSEATASPSQRPPQGSSLWREASGPSDPAAGELSGKSSKTTTRLLWTIFSYIPKLWHHTTNNRLIANVYDQGTNIIFSPHEIACLGCLEKSMEIAINDAWFRRTILSCANLLRCISKYSLKISNNCLILLQ